VREESVDRTSPSKEGGEGDLKDIFERGGGAGGKERGGPAFTGGLGGDEKG